MPGRLAATQDGVPPRAHIALLASAPFLAAHPLEKPHNARYRAGVWRYRPVRLSLGR